MSKKELAVCRVKPDQGDDIQYDGNPRHSVRVRWIDREAKTYQEAFLGPATVRSHIPEDPIGTWRPVRWPRRATENPQDIVL